MLLVELVRILVLPLRDTRPKRNENTASVKAMKMMMTLIWTCYCYDYDDCYCCCYCCYFERCWKKRRITTGMKARQIHDPSFVEYNHYDDDYSLKNSSSMEMELSSSSHIPYSMEEM